MSTALLAATATGIPALLIIAGIIGIIISVGVLIAGKKPLAGTIAAGCAAAILIGVILAALD